MADQHLIKLIVQDTENIIFDGEVDRITSYNEMGRFDVYPMHANFISIITKQVDLYSNRQKIKEIPIEQAVMKVKKDIVHIFLGIEMLLMDDPDPTISPELPIKK
jgi:F0F1-type ATP synthase epsilon subunit